MQIQIQFEICNLSCTSPLPTLPCTATVSTTCTSSSRLDPQLLTLPLVCNISSSWLQHKSQPLFHLSLLATSSNTTSTCHFHWNRSHGTSPLPQSALGESVRISSQVIINFRPLPCLPYIPSCLSDHNGAFPHISIWQPTPPKTIEPLVYGRARSGKSCNSSFHNSGEIAGCETAHDPIKMC